MNFPPKINALKSYTFLSHFRPCKSIKSKTSFCNGDLKSRAKQPASLAEKNVLWVELIFRCTATLSSFYIRQGEGMCTDLFYEHKQLERNSEDV